MEALSYRLKMARNMLNISRVEAADMLGIHIQYLADIEGGRRIPSMKMMERISRAYMLPVFWFFLPEDVEQDVTITLRLPIRDNK